MSLFRRKIASRTQPSRQSGFTIVEVTIVIIVIGIVTTISALSMSGVLLNSRDKQRSAKTTVLAEALEKYFQQNGVYPTCDKLTQPSNIVATTVLPGLDPTALTAPGAATGTNSITCEANGTNMITYNLADNGSYTLEYVTESDKKTVVINSRYNGGALLGDVNLVVDSVTSNRVRLSWQSVVDANNYRIQRSTSSDFKSGMIEDNTTGLSFNSNGLASGVKYYFRVIAKGFNASSPWAYATATTLIDAPSRPTITMASTATTTAFNWSAVTCSAGTVPNYQYKYNINGTDISGWTTPSAIPFVATTNYQGSTYTFTLRARCTTAAAVSPWSPSDVVSYVRPIDPPTMPGLAARYSAPYASASVSPVTCGLGTTAEYSIRYRTNDGAWGVYSAWSTSPTLSVTAVQGVKYGFMAQARCNTTLGSGPIVTSTEATYIHPIMNPPAAPVVTALAAGSNTTWSWPTVTCSAGTVSYQYLYTINNGYSSGWKALSLPPFTAATPNEGYTFTVAVQAKCSNAYTSSVWSTSGTASYYRPITVPPAPTVSVSQNASTLTATIPALPCINGTTTQYSIRSRTNNGAWGSYSAWGTNTVFTQSATQGVKYGYQAQARCHMTLSDSSATAGGEVSYTSPITSYPSGTPSVSANTSGSTTTFSWSTISCPVGVIGYQYYYTNSSNGSNSGWIATNSNSFAINTGSEGATYTAYVQARCSTAYASGPWSSSGTASYRRPRNMVASYNISSSSQAQTLTQNIPGLISVNSVYSNTGSVTSYWNSGTSVTANVNYGTASSTTSSTWNSYKYSTTKYSTQGPQYSTSFPASMWYNDGSYSGTLYYNGYTTNPGSSVWNSTKYSKTVNDSIGPQSSSSFPRTKSYNDGSYSGTLNFTGSSGSRPSCYVNFTSTQIAGIGDKPPSSPRYMSWDPYWNWDKSYDSGCTSKYSGDVYFAGWNWNAIYTTNWAGKTSYYSKWTGTLYGPGSYTGNYSGTVYKGGYDTSASTYTGNYSGTTYMGGYDTSTSYYYPYTITINYQSY